MKGMVNVKNENQNERTKEKYQRMKLIDRREKE